MQTTITKIQRTSESNYIFRSMTSYKGRVMLRIPRLLLLILQGLRFEWALTYVRWSFDPT